MKTLLVCCLAVLAAAASTQPKPFQGQQTHVYRFDTQVSTSLIGASPAEIQQAAATRLRADAHLSFTDERHAKLQLKSIRIGELNSELPKSQRVQPLEHFEPRELSADLKEILEMPLSVSYVDGVVERINFHEDDSTWSKNIKRAVLNMIQLNLKRNNVQSLKMQGSMLESNENKDEPVFSIPEITLEGECEVVYTVQKPQHANNDETERMPFNVTKTINFNKCQRTVDLSYGYQPNPSEQLRCLNCLRQQTQRGQNAQQREQARFGYCQQECQPNKINDDEDVERSTYGRFELLGKPEKYAIKRAFMLSQYVVKAQNPASQNTLIQVVALSELTFKEQSINSQQKVQSFKQSSTDETLMYSPEWDIKEKRFYMNGDEERDKQSPFAKVQKKESEIAHAVRFILRQWSDKVQGYEVESALNFNRVVEIIRQSTVEEIRSAGNVVKQISNENEGNAPSGQTQQLIDAIFQDSLAAAATRNSLFVLAEMILKSEIKSAKAVQLLKSYTSNQHSPSEAQADILYRIATHEVAYRSPALKQAAWLSFGQTVGAICQDKPGQGQKQMFLVEEVCSEGKKEQYKKSLMQLMSQSETTYEKILALKAIGNAALDNTIEELQQLVNDKKQPTLVRIEAIDAMRRLRTSMPEKILQELLPVFQNQREQPEVRMTAFSMILHTNPEKSILDQLTFTTIHDRSQNVKSFVLTAMESLSKSPLLAEQEIATHMKAALKMVKFQPKDQRSSQKYNVPLYTSEQPNAEEQNIILSLASIVSPSNSIPVHLSASLNSALNGETSEENLKVSMTQKNLEKWLENIMKLAQGYSKRNKDEQEKIERRSAKDLRAIYSSLGIKNRRTGNYYLSSSQESNEDDQQEEGKQQRQAGDNQPFGMIVIRTNDVDQIIVPVDEQHLPQVVRNLIKGEKPLIMSQSEELIQHLSSGQKFQLHAGMNVGEKRTKIPTTSGLPLSLSRQTFAIGSVEGEIKTRLESDNLEGSRGLTATLKVHASAIVTHLHKAETWSPVTISGVQTYRTVEFNGPIELKMRVDSNKVELKARLPQENRVRFFAVHTLPSTYTRQVDMQTHTRSETHFQTVYNWALEHTQREPQNQQESSIQVEGTYHHVSNPKQILQAMYTTENNVHFYYNPSQRTPKELILRISGSAFQKHSEHSGPELQSFYSKNRGFQSIYEDEESTYTEQEKQRQQRLSTYSQQYSGKDAYKHQLRVEAEAHCGDKKHKIMADIKGACDARLAHCKFFLEAERTPLQSESQPWHMKAKIQTVAPEVLKENEDVSQKQSRMLAQIESEWGSAGQNQMNIRFQAEPTKNYYQKSNSQTFARFLNKYDLIAEYQLQPAQKRVFKRLYELAKAKFFWSTSVEEHRSKDGEGVVRAAITIDPNTGRHANVTIQTPHERMRLKSLELPTRVSPYLLQRRPISIRSISNLIDSATNFGGAECRADERRIRTFDGVWYRAPMSECWSVLAKDCSRDEPRFVVMMKESEEKKVKIITQDKTIELVSKNQQKPIVKINGEQEKDERELSEQGVDQSHNQVFVRVPGVSVQFDGEEVKIRVSSMYKNLQCGLCGHYSDEEEDEFRMSNGQRGDSLKQFHQSYTLKNQECDSKKLNNFYSEQDSQEFAIYRPSFSQKGRREQNQWFSDVDSDESQDRQEDKEEDSSEAKQQLKPIESTKVIEYHHRVCFSTQPVKRCPRYTMPKENEQTESVDAEFFCLNRTSAEARRLLRQARQGKIVQNNGNAPSFKEQVEQPKACQAVN